MRHPGQPLPDLWPAKGPAEAFKTFTDQKVTHAGAAVPQIKWCVQIFLAVLPFLCVEIGFNQQLWGIVQQMAETADAILNNSHIVIGGQGETVLHGKHGDSPESD
ncbi:hypothetical protein D3C73_945020 [compost metagenome]